MWRSWQPAARQLADLVSQWEIRMEDAEAFPSPAAKYPDPRAYYSGVGGKGPHAFNWTDKPHRLVYDLTLMVATLRDELRALVAANPGASR